MNSGFLITQLNLPNLIRDKVLERNWIALDQAIRIETEPGGTIFEELQKYAAFSSIEFIISIRSSLSEPDEDGIWHDDGSRVLAFSLSLSLNHGEIEGGRLGIRKIGEESNVTFIPTPAFGTMIIFQTGKDGFEHRIHRVSQGERVIIAGWCT